MADNTILNSGTGGDTIATDDLTTLNGLAVSGFKVQRVKVGFGVDASLRDVDAANGLPVSGTVADGADVAEGHTTDAAWVNGAGTVISLLKKIASDTYATKVTAISPNTYVAIAPIGSAQASAVWQAKKVTVTGNDTVITWAGGGAFNQVATDLTVLTYA